MDTVRRYSVNEVVGFFGSSVLLLLVVASYFGGMGFLLFLLDKASSDKKQR